KHYDALIKRLIFGNTPFRGSLYFNNDGVPAIGFNFELNNTITINQVLKALGFDLTGRKLSGEARTAERYYMGLLHSAFNQCNGNDLESLKVVVHNIFNARLSDTRYQHVPHFIRTNAFELSSERKGVAIVCDLLKYHEQTLDNWLTVFGFDILKVNSHLLSRNTRERAALLSLVAQRQIGVDRSGEPKGLSLAHALMEDNRPEAWYQIRYGFMDNPQTAKQAIKRRYFESELFDIYDEGTGSDNIEHAYCKKMYAMYNGHKDIILDHERRFGYLIAEANTDLGLSGKHTIKTIEQSFSLAYNHIRNQPYASAPINNFVKTYSDYVEDGIEQLSKSWSQPEDLDYEIAMAS
ncbi:MAG: hypothetical protein PVF34_13265, partial [Gammaproteobacteria bacterium]